MPKSCWAPCFRLTEEYLESRPATILIAWYTFVLHILSLVYFIGIANGNRSDEFYSPLFEYGIPDMSRLAVLAAIYSVLYLILGSLCLIRGVKTETRIYYFPWLWMTALEILYLLWHGAFLTWRYSQNPYAYLATLIIYIYTAYHSYLYSVVLSNYYFLKKIQNPTFILLPA